MKNIFEDGKMFIGCNYWASHAGTRMWCDWDEKTVDDDFERLSKNKIKYVRVFPMWNDFQPIKMHLTCQCVNRELRIGEDLLPFTPEGQSGIDPVMIDRFQKLCNIAKKYDIKLVVGLITGWMSGRMYIPEALIGKNLLTDPFAVRWEIKYVKYLVERFKNEESIVAWDLGNECNCLGVASRDEAYVWEMLIANTIRLADSTRPVVSGMHGITPEGIWDPKDQAEAVDVLCTHPYPLFTPYCNTDPINTMKNILHATAQSLYYEGLSGKPCFVEEAGTLGPIVSNDTVAGDYIGAAMFSCWSNGITGYMWWCANEQSRLTHTPYDWIAVERHLGLFDEDKKPKPVLKNMTRFADYLEKLPIKKLPSNIKDAVCILSQNQDNWAAAYGAYILAKQAGLDIEFCWCKDEIPESRVYIVPALCGDQSLSRTVIKQLKEKVANGATLYWSVDDMFILESDFTGVEVVSRQMRFNADCVKFAGNDYTFGTEYYHNLKTVGAKVLAQNGSGNPIFTKNTYGKGTVYTLAYPIEKLAAATPGAIYGENKTDYFEFYKALQIRNKTRVASCDDCYIGVTEHIVSESERIITLLNFTPTQKTAEISLDEYKFDTHFPLADETVTESNNGFSVTLPKNSGTVVLIKKA